MKTRTVAAAVLVSLAATLAGCGGSDPAGAKVEEFFALMGKGSISRAIPECGSASEPKDPFALKSWGDKFRGMVGGNVSGKSRPVTRNPSLMGCLRTTENSISHKNPTP